MGNKIKITRIRLKKHQKLVIFFNHSIYDWILTIIKTTLNLKKSAYLVIKYEDLIKNSNKELNKIKKFLSLKKKIDLKTTFLNHEWSSNNFVGKKKTSISKININRFMKVCSKDEIKNLEFYFYNYLIKYKYKIQFKKELNVFAAAEFYKNTNKDFFQ